jgi:hypothetical protein
MLTMKPFWIPSDFSFSVASTTSCLQEIISMPVHTDDLSPASLWHS